MTIQSDFTDDIDRIQEIAQVPLILEVCSRATGMRWTAVSRVTEKNWVTCAVHDQLEFGLVPGSELPIETTFCDSIRSTGDPVIFDDADTDDVYCDHPIARQYGIGSYISVPIYRGSGDFFGTLCALDPEPRSVKASHALPMFQLFATMIGRSLDEQDYLMALEENAERDRLNSQLREEFIGVVGHDIRNPITAIKAGIRMIERTPEKDHGDLLKEMSKTADRMDRIVANLLDLSRGRLGGGLQLHGKRPVNMAGLLQDLVREMEQAHGVTIETDISLSKPVHCDEVRLGQLIMNLLVNAATHGETGKPIALSAEQKSGQLHIHVENHGPLIPRKTLKHLFEPYYRSSDGGTTEGLGLGLYISQQIAAAHGGRITASSDHDTTVFSFEMPLD